MVARFRFMVQVKDPSDGELFLLHKSNPRGMTKFGSAAKHFPDAKAAEAHALLFRRHNPGWGTKVVEDLGIPTPAETK